LLRSLKPISNIRAPPHTLHRFQRIGTSRQDQSPLNMVFFGIVAVQANTHADLAMHLARMTY